MSFDSFQSHSCRLERRPDYDVYTFTSSEQCSDYSQFDPFLFLFRALIRHFGHANSVVLIGSMDLERRDEVHNLYVQQTGRQGAFSRLNFSDGFWFSEDDWQGVLLDKLPDLPGSVLEDLLCDSMICVIVGGNRPEAIGESLTELAADASEEEIIGRLMMDCDALIFPGHDGLDLKIYAHRRFWSSDLG